MTLPLFQGSTNLDAHIFKFDPENYVWEQLPVILPQRMLGTIAIPIPTTFDHTQFSCL